VNLKELIGEVRILKLKRKQLIRRNRTRLYGIKQTVEAVDEIRHWNGSTICRLMVSESIEDWEKLKKLLGLK